MKELEDAFRQKEQHSTSEQTKLRVEISALDQQRASIADAERNLKQKRSEMEMELRKKEVGYMEQVRRAQEEEGLLRDAVNRMMTANQDLADKLHDAQSKNLQLTEQLAKMRAVELLYKESQSQLEAARKSEAQTKEMYQRKCEQAKMLKQQLRALTSNSMLATSPPTSPPTAVAPLTAMPGTPSSPAAHPSGNAAIAPTRPPVTTSITTLLAHSPMDNQSPGGSNGKPLTMTTTISSPNKVHPLGSPNTTTSPHVTTIQTKLPPRPQSILEEITRLQGESLFMLDTGAYSPEDPIIMELEQQITELQKALPLVLEEHGISPEQLPTSADAQTQHGS
eukprot:TRINITY_DN69640_c0_g1_i1.p1 TRINITY_DN69640_c0_g1~~TRINITY_DN69640_c0_g1_i1.p1  ORF type:complete len:379 (-),score=57.80 TRINITY_DN69640_c0_g1_i1:47-1057(-)